MDLSFGRESWDPVSGSWQTATATKLCAVDRTRAGALGSTHRGRHKAGENMFLWEYASQGFAKCYFPVPHSSRVLASGDWAWPFAGIHPLAWIRPGVRGLHSGKHQESLSCWAPVCQALSQIRFQPVGWDIHRWAMGHRRSEQSSFIKTILGGSNFPQFELVILFRPKGMKNNWCTDNGKKQWQMA